MNSPAIVDSHVHLWDPERFAYPWLSELPVLQRSFSADDFMEAAKPLSVNKYIAVESGANSASNIPEVKWISELANKDARLRGIIANAALERGCAVLPELEELSKNPLVKGIRRNLQGEHDGEFMRRTDFLTGVDLLSQFQFTFDLCIRADQLTATVELVRRFPQVHFVLDHCGKPPIKTGSSKAWAAGLETLAFLPNAACKISGLTTEANWDKWQPDDLKYYFDCALQSFGFDRLLFGSDWPVATLATTYERWLSVVTEFFSFATENERSKLFQLNTEKFYRV